MNNLSIIAILFILVLGLIVPEANALKLKIGTGNVMMSSLDGSFSGELVYEGDIGKKNTAQPVEIKVFGRNETLIQSYTVPVSILDLDNGTFRYKTHLSGVYPYDIYLIEFSYGNQTVMKQYPYAYGSNGNRTLGSYYITPSWQLRKGIATNDIAYWIRPC